MYIRLLNIKYSENRSYAVVLKFKQMVGESHLFATLPDLRPPPLQRHWWGIKAQNTCQNVGHVHSVRSDPLRFSHLSGGRYQAMENEKCNFLT